jgi:hypothetical protein
MPYTYQVPVEIEKEGAFKRAYFIRLAIDLKRPDLGLDIATVLHERAHHFATNRATKNSQEHIELLNDSAFQEGLSDYLTAHSMRDPNISRNFSPTFVGIRNIAHLVEQFDTGARKVASPLMATDNKGSLEEHSLSFFYSHALWNTFAEAQNSIGMTSRISAAELWGDFFSGMQSYQNLYNSHQKEKFLNWGHSLTQESLFARNLDFFL